MFSLGDCLGMPFSSTTRYPLMPTYGLKILTGWNVCSTTCTQVEPEHSLGKFVRRNMAIKTYSRAILKHRYLWHSSQVTERIRKRELSTMIVLTPNMTQLNDVSNLKLLIRLEEDLTILSPMLAMIQDASDGCRYIKLSVLESVQSTTIANLTATISNIGEVLFHTSYNYSSLHIMDLKGWR